MDVHVNCKKFIVDIVGKNTSDKLIVIKHTIKKRDFISILRDPRWCPLRLAILQEVINDLKSIVNSFKVVQASDTTEISRQGYMAIYNVFLNALCTRGLKNPLLLRPYHVKKSRKSSNSTMQDLLGGFIHTMDTMEICRGPLPKST